MHSLKSYSFQACELLDTGTFLAVEQDSKALAGQKQRQQRYYNRSPKHLKPISLGDSVRIKFDYQVARNGVLVCAEMSLVLEVIKWR